MSWRQGWSKTQQKTYWFNNTTKQTVWEKPSDFEDKKEEETSKEEKKSVREPQQYKEYRKRPYESKHHPDQNDNKQKKNTEWKNMQGDAKEKRDQELRDLAKKALSLSAKVYKETSPSIEILRFKEANKLRRYLDDLIQRQSKRTPSNAFERFLLSQKLIDTGDDPLFSSTYEINTGLLHELERIRIPYLAAEKICKDIAKACSDSALIISRASASNEENEGVNLKSENNITTLSFTEYSFSINDIHFNKLKELYEKKEENDPKLLHSRIFCLLARYNALGGPGYQAALPIEVFEILSSEFGVTHESFASPFNCFYSSFGSAFYDTDKYFGSTGSFFQTNFTEGSYEANPPFLEETMAVMAIRIRELLEASDKALSFVVIVPGWTDAIYYDVFKSSKYLRKMLTLLPNKHSYMEGFQHQMERQRKAAECTSFVFFLQTDEGAKKWPLKEDAVKKLEEYFSKV